MSKTMLMELDPAVLIPTPDNPEGRADPKSESFRDLVASIRGKGVQVPGQARPHPNKPGQYDLLDGSRRRAACAEIGCMMPVLVHEDLDDAAAFDLCFAANFAREDLTPMQEAAAVRITLGKYQQDLFAVAVKFGRSQQWVAMRLKVGEIAPKVREKLGRNGRTDNWTMGHWAVVARLPAGIQAHWAQNGRFDRDWTVKELEQFLNDEYLRLLPKAPWAADSADILPAAGACSACPKRSSQEALLFHGDEPEETVAATDRCLDPGCWAKKQAAWLKFRRAELEAEHKRNVPAISESYLGYYGERDLKRQGFSDVIGPGAYVTCGKSEKGATPALVVHGKGTGQLRWVRPPSTGRRARGGEKGKATPLAVRRANLEKRRLCHAIDELARTIGELGPDAVDPDQLDALAAVFGIERPGWQDKRDRWKLYSEIVGDGPKRKTELWIKARARLCENITQQRHRLSGEAGYKDCKPVTAWCTSAAAVVKIQFAELSTAAVAAIPEPKTWKNLNADGTPKTTPTTKSTKGAKGKGKKKGRAKTPAQQAADERVCKAIKEMQTPADPPPAVNREVYLKVKHNGLSAGRHTVTAIKVGRAWTRFTDSGGRRHKIRNAQVTVYGAEAAE
ncbi:MAG TPA: ParB/RepB/Spo0J family partition protein [Phycisphaerae bacterium]|nr:ParB/RepB/Spo0J family partition protein [Phycisphaerae bacterium]